MSALSSFFLGMMVTGMWGYMFGATIRNWPVCGSFLVSYGIGFVGFFFS